MSSSRYYRRRKSHGRRHYGRKLHHRHHKHTYEYYEPSYERVYEREYDPHEDDDIVYRDEDIGGGRVAFDTGSWFGGLDLAAAPSFDFCSIKIEWKLKEIKTKL